MYGYGYNLSIRVAISDIGNVLTGRFYINCLGVSLVQLFEKVHNEKSGVL